MKIKHDQDSENKKPSIFERFRDAFGRFLEPLLKRKKAISILYLLGMTLAATFMITIIGQDVFPRVNSSQFQLRVKAPDGTRMERTEEMAQQVLEEIENYVGKEHIGISSSYVGMHATQHAVSPIYLFMAGPHEAVFQIALEDYYTNMDEFKDQLRLRIAHKIPQLKLSFEPIELTEKILSQGSPTPIEIRLTGRDKATNVQFAQRLVDSLSAIPYFRDVQIAQSTQYPTLDIDIDRTKAAQLGVDMNDISRSLVASTSSSRYTERNTWLDERTGLSYAVQVQVPLGTLNDIHDLQQIALLGNSSRPILGDVATITQGVTNGQTDNLGTTPRLSVTANTHKTDLRTASEDVKKVIANLGELPRGLFIDQVGLGTVLEETMSSLQGGLMIAVVVIFLMLSANFQSFKVSLIILTTTPAVVLGSLLLLLATGSTLNLQSYMGIIMSVGVSIANAVLLITNAEQVRRENGGDAIAAAKKAVSVRIRPIIMTSLAMIAGMLPLAIGHGESGEQVAPLGRAVIGGLLFSTFAVLIILPLIFSWVQSKTTLQSISLHPDDKDSKFYDDTNLTK